MSSRMDTTVGDPQTVDEARNAVERSRERISSTLDSLEDRIVEKKHELQDKADVLRPVREQVVERPFTAMAVAVGVGALLGSLGGSDEGSRYRERYERNGGMSADERAELREWRRARRERLQARLDDRDDRDDRDRDDSGGSRMSDLKHQLMGAVTTAIGTAVTTRIKEMAMGSSSSPNGRTTVRD